MTPLTIVELAALDALYETREWRASAVLEHRMLRRNLIERHGAGLRLTVAGRRALLPELARTWSPSALAGMPPASVERDSGRGGERDAARVRAAARAR